MPNDSRDDESGQFTEKYDRDDFLAAIDAADGLAGTQDVADYVGCSRPTAHLVLEELADAGRVTKRKIGGSAVWQRTSEDTPSTDGGHATADKRATTAGDEEETTTTVAVEDVGDATLAAQIAALDLPGEMDRPEGRAALRACYGLLVARGEATADLLKQAVYPDYDAGYASADEWWAAISDGLHALTEQRDDLRPPAGDNGVYRYFGS
jgi:hypothetical protein